MPTIVGTNVTPSTTVFEMMKLRAIPAIAPLVGISKSELYEWASQGRVQIECLGSGSKPQMRTTLAWCQDTIDALPNLGD